MVSPSSNYPFTTGTNNSIYLEIGGNFYKVSTIDTISATGINNVQISSNTVVATNSTTTSLSYKIVTK